MTAHYSNLERYYNIVYDQQFSPGGKHLATCDTFGKLAIFSLSAALNHSASTDGKAPLKVKQAHSGPAYALTTAGSLLASGGADSVKLWKWEELTAPSNDPQSLQVLTPPPGKLGATDTNALAYDKESDVLYGGCGDGNIRGWDLSTNTIKVSENMSSALLQFCLWINSTSGYSDRAVLTTFSGHSDYVHCLCLRRGGQLLSAAEDGTVKMWDPSSGKNPVQTWKPAKGTAHWVGCVAVDEGGDWMVCGGSMAPAIFHLASNCKITSLPVPSNVVTQTAIFANDRIITAGSEPTVRHWAVNGEPIAAVPGGHQHTFSLAYNTHASKQYEVLTVGGDSSSIHVFTDFGYKAFSLNII